MASSFMIRDQFSIVMHRTLLELHGVSCIELEHTQAPRKQIVASRSFGQRIYHIDDLKEAMSLYVQDAVARLRGENMLCGYMIGFVQSNPFDTHRPYYSKSAALTLPKPTDNVLTLCKIAIKMIDDLYQKDVGFKKCGVILTCLEPKSSHIYDLFTDMKQITADNNLMELAMGASMLPNRSWNMSRDQLSQNYFQWDQLLCVK